MCGAIALLDRIERGLELSMDDLTSTEVHWLVDEGYARYVGLTVEVTRFGHHRLQAYRKAAESRAARKAIASTAD